MVMKEQCVLGQLFAALLTDHPQHYHQYGFNVVAEDKDMGFYIY